MLTEACQTHPYLPPRPSISPRIANPFPPDHQPSLVNNLAFYCQPPKPISRRSRSVPPALSRNASSSPRRASLPTPLQSTPPLSNAPATTGQTSSFPSASSPSPLGAIAEGDEGLFFAEPQSFLIETDPRKGAAAEMLLKQKEQFQVQEQNENKRPATMVPEQRSRTISIFKRLTTRSRKFRAMAKELGQGESEGSISPALPYSNPASPTLTQDDKGEGKEEKIRYIETKTKNKATKDFCNLFVAQELFILPTVPVASSPTSPTFASSTSSAAERSPPTSSSNPSEGMPGSPHSTTTSTSSGCRKNSVWAMEWSHCGRGLAVGGKDGVVRVWEVLDTPEARATNGATSPSSPFSPSPPSTPSKRRNTNPTPAMPVDRMPVFASKPLHEFQGHTADVLDLSWSRKDNFLLSSSMDNTVRLWHVERKDCLIVFEHLDFVTSVCFHPSDDRFFLSGSMDCKLRLWSISDRRVHLWTQLPEMITSVAFDKDGKLAIAGDLSGNCRFYDVHSLCYQSQLRAPSPRGKNLGPGKGKKISSIVNVPKSLSTPGDRLLVSSNDSKLRLFDVAEKALKHKYFGHENTSSQIKASFSSDGKYIISGSEDKHVYIWDSGLDSEHPASRGFLGKKNVTGLESFQLSTNVITCATFAPAEALEVLSHSADPIFSYALELAPTRDTFKSAMSGGAYKFRSAIRRNSLPPSVEAANSIIVVADGSSGVITVLRNSAMQPLSPEVKQRSKRKWSKVSV